MRPSSSSTNRLPPRRSSVSHITSDTLDLDARTPRSAWAKRAGRRRPTHPTHAARAAAPRA
jgi:hypothetical protein